MLIFYNKKADFELWGREIAGLEKVFENTFIALDLNNWLIIKKNNVVYKGIEETFCAQNLPLR